MSAFSRFLLYTLWHGLDWIGGGGGWEILASMGSMCRWIKRERIKKKSWKEREREGEREKEKEKERRRMRKREGESRQLIS